MPSSEFLILASQGLWSVLSIEEISDIIDAQMYQKKSSPNVTELSELIVEEALERWRERSEQNILDVTLILLLFNRSQ